MIDVSQDESRDHIGTVALSATDASRTLTVTFEQQQRTVNPTYPDCDRVLSPLVVRYGAPRRVREAQEERSLNRRYEWEARGTTMTLSCFRNAHTADVRGASRHRLLIDRDAQLVVDVLRDVLPMR